MATASVTTVAASSTPVRISGTGDDVVAFSASGIDLRVFSMTHSGSSNFAVELLDEQGNYEELLVNEIGAYNGKKSSRLTAGEYFLDITADGPWTVEISPSVTQINAITDSNPQTFSGTGDDVKTFTTTGTGLRIFTMQHTGSSNFAVELTDDKGNYVELLVNEIGLYSGKKSEKLEPGAYVLEITADGPWTIQVAS